MRDMDHRPLLPPPSPEDNAPRVAAAVEAIDRFLITLCDPEPVIVVPDIVRPS